MSEDGNRTTHMNQTRSSSLSDTTDTTGDRDKTMEKQEGKEKCARTGGEMRKDDPGPSDEGSSQPNIYSKFVTSFENALHDLIGLEKLEPEVKQRLPSLDLEGVAAFIREEQPSIVFMALASTTIWQPIKYPVRTPFLTLDTSSGIPSPFLYWQRNCSMSTSSRLQPTISFAWSRRRAYFDAVSHKVIWHAEHEFDLRFAILYHICQDAPCQITLRKNIDSLEFLAGLSEDKVITAHGSHRSSTCLSCKKKYRYDWFIGKLRDSEMKVLRCEHCKKGVVKPDIVFFGESLPSRFFSSSLIDFPKCELLIIMGTSLVVHPFASLVDNVPAATPRLLMNLMPVGQDSLSYNMEGNVRDVFWQGECDEGVFRLARLLGWEQELKALVIKEGKAATADDMKSDESTGKKA